MKKFLQSVFRVFVFWWVLFFLERLVFLLFFHQKLRGVSFGEILKSFLYGLWMDTSTAGYFSAIPVLVLILFSFVSFMKWKSSWLRIYFRTFLILFSLITVANLNVYREWGSKLNNRAFDFLINSPGEALASSASSPIALSLLILFALLMLMWPLSSWCSKAEPDRTSVWFLKIPSAIVVLALNFLAIRGGWQLAPMNESMAYFSSSPVLNHAAVNTEWALLHSVFSSSSHKNPYPYFKEEELKSRIQQLENVPSDSTIQLLNTQRPNIVLIVLESFTADVVASLGGEKDIDPGIERLLKQGVLFKNTYASGDRTDKGIVAILSAFPTQGHQSIMKENAKQGKLGSLYKSLGAAGYKTAFYYGGETEFANMRSYLYNTGCQQIVDKSDFDKKDMNSKWGAYDQVVYKRLLNDMDHRQEPFFGTLLTLTNHEPFELPVQPHFPGEELENKFRSTARFTDSCLYDFIQQARQHQWYKNTLFVVVADHGHRLPKSKYEIYDVHRFRIPLFWFGEVIKPEFRGAKLDMVTSQTDIAATLLAQQGLSHKEFVWSKNVLNAKAPKHAFFSWDGGFGFVNQHNQAITYDHLSNKILYRERQSEKQLQQDLYNAKAYMQAVFQQFLAY